MTANRARATTPLAGVLTAVLLILGLPGSVASATASVTPARAVAVKTAAQTATYERQVQWHVNKVRRQRGLPVLRLARCTDRVATRWTQHLAATGRFYHQSMYAVLRRCNARYAGETLGKGGMTPQRLVQMWMQSPPHRAVLTNRKSRHIGVAARPDASGQWVVTANFMRF